MHLRTKILAFAALPLSALALLSFRLDTGLAEGLVRVDAERSARAWMWRVRSAFEERLARDAVELANMTEVSSDVAWALDTDLLARFDADFRLLDCHRRTPDMVDGQSLLASWVEPLTAAARWLKSEDARAVMQGFVELDGKVLGLVVGTSDGGDSLTMIGRWVNRAAFDTLPVTEGVAVEMLPRGVALPSEEDALVHVRSDENRLLLDRRVAGRVAAYSALCDPSGMVAGFLRVEFDHHVALLVPRVMRASGLGMLGLFAGVLGALVWFLTRHGERRLQRMIEAVQVIQTDAGGRCLVPVEFQDEFGRLGHAVNTFVNRLRVDVLEVERMARAKTDFLATMSHEIRTPMTALSGYADILIDDTVSDRERKEAVGTIHRNGFHLLAVLNEILDLTHVEDGDISIQFQVCEPREIVLGIQDLSRMRASARGLSLDVEVHPDVPRCVECDPMRVRQVLLNLVGNALKFTQEGGVTISVRTERTEEDLRLVFEVRDTGVGMTEVQLERVFDPFQQAESSTQRRFGGTGLGLNISRRIAELHDGSLTAESAAGEGTKFLLSIAVREARSSGASVSDTHCGEASAQCVSELSVLVCESVIETRMLLASQLRAAGMEVALAADALSACQGALRSGQDFDVIVLDMQSPDSDACVMAQLLRRANFEGAILAMTASPSVDERARCLSSGCSDYLFKPFLQLEFISLVRRLALGGRS